MEGLSPYTRGNPRHRQAILRGLRSIPVHTGKPVAILRMFAMWGVYPRTHGETLSQHKFLSFQVGLSPYTRGNLKNGIAHC